MNPCKRFKSHHSHFCYNGTCAGNFFYWIKDQRQFAAIFFLLFCYLMTPGLSAAEEADPFAQMGVFQLKDMPEAPDFILLDLKGKKRSLGDFKGRYVMLNFWATW